MAKILNYAPHAWQFTADYPKAEIVTIPAATPIAGGVKPAVAEVSDQDLAKMKASPVAKGWFSPDGLVEE